MKHSMLGLLLTTTTLLMTACVSQTATPAAAAPQTVVVPKLVMLPAPKYLNVPHFQRCLKTQAVTTAKFWCLPSHRPANCPSASWTALQTEFANAKCS